MENVTGSVIVTALFHQLIIRTLTPSYSLKIRLHIYSLISSLIYTVFYYTEFNAGKYGVTFTLLQQIMLGSHIGYFLSDGIFCVQMGSWQYPLHHIFGSWWLYLLYQRNDVWEYMFGMLTAEASAVLVNLRYLLIKKYGSIPRCFQALVIIVYANLRIVLTVLYLIWKHLLVTSGLQLSSNEWQSLILELVYIAASSLWVVQLLNRYKIKSKDI